MPIYEYECVKCGHGFEHLARTLAEAAPVCPKCGAKKPQKQLSVFSPSAAPGGGESACEAAGCPSAGSCPSGKCPFN